MRMRSLWPTHVKDSLTIPLKTSCTFIVLKMLPKWINILKWCLRFIEYVYPLTISQLPSKVCVVCERESECVCMCVCVWASLIWKWESNQKLFIVTSRLSHKSLCEGDFRGVKYCNNISGNTKVDSKLWQITQPAIDIRQKLADWTITRVRTHVKSMVGIRLEIKSSTFEIDK